MKRKLFTLLLAMGLLTAFQANAQTRVRILADTSGLANTRPGTSVRHDSFPNSKTELYRWLSVNESGEFYVKSAEKNDTAAFRDELYPDKSGIFELFFVSPDSVNYEIYAGSSNRLTLPNTEGYPRSYFEIIKLNSEKRGSIISYKDKGDTEGDTVSSAGFKAEGYLSSFLTGDSLKMDTINFSMVGADKNGKLSIKKFKDFAIYGDSLPYAPFWKYQYDDYILPGKLYQSDSLNHFQLYNVHQEHISIGSDAGNGRELFAFGGDKKKAANWGRTGDKPNPNDPKVYTYLDIDVVGDHSIKLLDTVVNLSEIAKFAGQLKDGKANVYGANNRFPWGGIKNLPAKTVGIASNSTLNDPIGKNAGDTLAYLKKDADGKLSFTVRTSDTEWTYGTPTKFADDKYYYIDSMFMAILPTIIDNFTAVDSAKTAGELTSLDTLFLPELNRVPRYLYKNNDDGWRPLYVKIEQVPEEIPVKYVGQKWVKDNKYHLSAALQKIVGTPSGHISTDGTGNAIVSGNSDDAYRFSFEFADSIRKGGDTNQEHKFAVTSAPSHLKFSNVDSVELFRISYDNKYLTVLKKTEFTVAPGDTSVANMQLGWADKINLNTESARQFFAIVRNCVDSSVTFLPVASYKKKLGNGVAQYDDSLSYNVGIGKLANYGDADSIADLSATWYLIEWSGTRNLVVADSVSKQPRMWFELEFPLLPWNSYQEGKIASIKNVSTGRYYRGDNSSHDGDAVTANDIRAHWKIRKNKQDEDKYTFTPVIDNIYGTPQHGPTTFSYSVQAFLDGEDVVIIDESGSKILDTVRVTYDIKQEEFSLFGEIDNKIGKKVTIVSSDGDNISFGSKDNDNAYLASYNSDVIRATVHGSVEQWLDKDGVYRVPYYIFSCKDENGREYFLNVADKKVRWVLLPEGEKTKLLAKTEIKPADSPEKDPYAPYRFALPRSDRGVYLQALDTTIKGSPRIVRIKGDDRNELEYAEAAVGNKSDEGIYGALDYYKQPVATVLSWKFDRTLPDALWIPASEFDFAEDGITEGVLTVDYNVVGFTFAGSKEENGVRYGVLSNDKKDPTISLKLKLPADHVESEETADGSEPTYYHIIYDDTYYLKDNGNEVRAVFAEEETESKFAFLQTSEEGKLLFAIVSGDEEDYRYLNSKGTNLVFSSDEDDRLSFQWGKLSDYTGLKVIGTSSAKVYGVAGGVKIVNASGAVAVYTVDGRLVTAQAVTSPYQTVAVPAGIYIVKNGADVAKVVVK